MTSRFAVLFAAALLVPTNAFFLNFPGFPGFSGACNCAAAPVCPQAPVCAPPPPPAPCFVHPPCAPAPVVSNNYGVFNGYAQDPAPVPHPQPISVEASPKNHEYSSGPAKTSYEAAKIEHNVEPEEHGDYDDDAEVDPASVDRSPAAQSFQAQHAPINPQAMKKSVKREAKHFGAECNSEALRKIILENVKATPAESKRAVQKAAREEVGGRIDVICSTGKFSYIVNSELYCEAEKAGVTCFAFRQAL
ncbi:hypothetical protein QR680_005295 [Steinernema hermaphroditum]|uniref:Ground-like domain-containing protein n=1 Tax=Steinernema hermaphroditum TaxID=289476 RepID=A0AA39LVD9_9BILA|nr:hypothetical protein QR680_005295 [Steinernema hermaphroditum]